MSKAFPVNIQNGLIDKINLLKESTPFDYGAEHNQTASTYAVGTHMFGISPDVPPGKVLVDGKITITSTRPIKIYGYIKQGPQSVGHARQTFYTLITGADGGSVTIDVPHLVYGGTDFQMLYDAHADGAGPYICTTITGNLFSDLDFSTDEKLMIIGDSISWGSMGNDSNGKLYFGETLWANRLKKQLRNDGKNLRVVNKAFGGSHSIHAFDASKEGFYDIDNVKLICIALGTNDSTGGSAQLATFKNNMLGLLKNLRDFHKNASIVFLAPPTTDTANRAENIGAYRTAVQEVANDTTLGGTARDVYFYDSSLAFGLNATATADTNFTNGERSAGSRLHPSGIGHGLIFDGLYPVIQETSFYQG